MSAMIFGGMAKGARKCRAFCTVGLVSASVDGLSSTEPRRRTRASIFDDGRARCSASVPKWTTSGQHLAVQIVFSQSPALYGAHGSTVALVHEYSARGTEFASVCRRLRHWLQGVPWSRGWEGRKKRPAGSGRQGLCVVELCDVVAAQSKSVDRGKR